jgi:hypothetical protein
MLKKSRKGAKPKQASAPSPPPAPPSAPSREYAKLGADAPIAWPSVGGRRVPVTGELSPHAASALKRMGITQ